MEIVRDSFDLRAELEAVQPFRRDRIKAKYQAEEIPGNRACAVAVAAVIHRQ